MLVKFLSINGGVLFQNAISPKIGHQENQKMWLCSIILREECDGSDEKWYSRMKIRITLTFFDHVYPWKVGMM